jgi:SAM-dependent methyltransferase
METTRVGNITTSTEVAASVAGYTKLVLSLYDPLVMLFENHLVWKCPTSAILDFYNAHISGKHLDVGVGTGYFLDRCRIPVPDPVIHLMDLSPNSLAKTAARIRRYRPVTHQWNILDPITLDLPAFDSICVSNVLHCIPGGMAGKEAVFRNLKRFLNPGGTLFGLTILGGMDRVGLLYRLFNRIYNRSSYFSNEDDSAEGLDLIIRKHFWTCTVAIEGSVAFFTCRL